VSLVDLTPTMLDLGGVEIDGTDGISLAAVARGEAEVPERDLWIAGTDGGQISQLCVRRPPWKLWVHVESGEEEAYNLEVDPREQHSAPDEVPAELRDVLYSELGVLEQPEMSDEDTARVESRLADLGYL
jgi:arylsulfatase A-like enzyme